MTVRILFVLALLGCCLPVAAAAQEPSEQPITRYAIDLHAALPKVPGNNDLGRPYGLDSTTLPGLGIGLSAGAHVYPLRLKKITFGVGVSGVLGRAHASPVKKSDGTLAGKDVTARFSALAPQISINFGSAAGWSYLSGGIATSRLEISTPDLPSDTTWPRTKTINYGGGGRWWVKDHVAASFDVRFYAMNPVAGAADSAEAVAAGQHTLRAPRLRMLVISMGVSFR